MPVITLTVPYLDGEFPLANLFRSHRAGSYGAVKHKDDRGQSRSVTNRDGSEVKVYGQRVDCLPISTSKSWSMVEPDPAGMCGNSLSVVSTNIKTSNELVHKYLNGSNVDV